MTHPARRRAVASATMGHILEWYDFGVYAFVAVNIARQIFPSDSEVASLLATFLAFGVGFLSRPLGGVLLGWYGDRYGAKAALVLTFSLMGLSTCAIGLIPSYASIGVLAPILMMLCRLLQGLSVGGEYAASATYLVSWAPPEKRGLYGSIQHMGSGIGALLGSGAGLGLSAALGAEAMQSWGWRVPFLLGAVMLALGVYMRRRAEAAPEVDVSGLRKPDGTAEGSDLARAVRLLVFAGMWAVPYYVVLFYLPTFFQKTLLLSQTSALTISTLSLVLYVAIVPLAGIVSDKVGRKKTIVAGALLSALVAVVAFPQMLASPSFGTALCAQIFLNLSLAFVSGPAPTTIVEMFPPRRMVWMSGAYGIALAIFGGFAPAFVTWLVSTTGLQTAPSYVLAAACLMLCLALLAGRETAPLRQARGGGAGRRPVEGVHSASVSPGSTTLTRETR